jgi:tetratricopeptide (TPR) repeat protein
MLAYEDYWSGQPVQGVAHGREAISLLERTDERWWLGMAQWIVALNCIPLGDFEAGRDATERANAVGEEIGDLRLQNYAAWTRGWIEATRGEWELGLEACRRALDRSQDPVNTAYAIGQMGYAYLEGGDVAQAIPLLEQAVEQWTRFQVRQTPGRFMTLLSEAYLASGRLEEAERLAEQALAISLSVKFLYAIGLAQRAAGKVAQARGDLDGAGPRLEEAFETFRVMGARFELARTQVALAELARARKDVPSAARHLREAARAFRSLGVPRHDERAARLARAWSMDL